MILIGRGLDSTQSQETNWKRPEKKLVLKAVQLSGCKGKAKYSKNQSYVLTNTLENAIIANVAREDRPQHLKSSHFPVMMAKGFHLFPYRTQKLSPSAPMVLGWTRPGRVGRCRNPYKREAVASLFFCVA